jgi:hypothetical protein
MIRTIILAFHKRLELIPNPTPLPTRLCHERTLVHVREYTQTICTLALNTLIA